MLSWVRFALVVVLILLALQTAPPLNAQSNSRYFAQTGHNVQGAFLEYFDRHGGIDVFGYPLTEQFYNNRQVLVQFFQRAVMEYRPTNPAPFKVQLALLGVWLGHQEPPIADVDIPHPSDRLKRYFAQTGHTVSYSFLSFFDRYGGVASFGHPITEFKIENGRIVQYFQRARMEWHPENSARYKIQLGLLGVEYADLIELDSNLMNRVAPLIPIATPTPRAATNNLSAVAAAPLCSAAVKYRVTGLQGVQIVNARVADKTSGQGLPDLDVLLTVRFPDGSQTFAAKTDPSGSAPMPFDIGVQQPGNIIVVEAGFAQNGSRICDPIKTYFLTWSTN